jgi:hypothetical protein
MMAGTMGCLVGVQGADGYRCRCGVVSVTGGAVDELDHGLGVRAGVGQDPAVPGAPAERGSVAGHGCVDPAVRP